MLNGNNVIPLVDLVLFPVQSSFMTINTQILGKERDMNSEALGSVCIF